MIRRTRTSCYECGAILGSDRTGWARLFEPAIQLRAWHCPLCAAEHQRVLEDDDARE